jgi:hypothetical protein
MIDQTSIAGNRWISQADQLEKFRDSNPVDGCGVGSQMSLFYFDPDGFAQIKVSEAMLSFALPMIQLKFEQMIHNIGDLWLCWQRKPADGLHVSDVIGDSERAWSLLRFYTSKLAGRQRAERDALRAHDSEGRKLVF